MNDDFEKVKAVKSMGINAPDQPVLVQQVMINSLSILLSNMENLFSSCDDLFFDLSSRAVSNSEQNLYFETMRELRVKKSGVTENFKRQLEQFFADSARPQTETEEPVSVKNEALSLVQEDEVEQKIALDGMVTKSRNHNQELLYQLATRLDYLTPGNRITENNNPLDPRQICRSFSLACDILSINIKARIIIYKQFDRLVVSGLSKLYSNANDLLINAGIIPTINRRQQRGANTSSKSGESTAERTTSQQENVDISPVAFESNAGQTTFDFSALSQLMQSIQQFGATNLIPNYQPYSANPGPLMSNEELQSTLNLLQGQLALSQSSNAGNASVNEVNIREIVDSILKEANPEVPKAVKQPDEDTINLVAMFFDFVLDDRNLPVSFQALLSRLQIPILKTALRDHSFFTNPQHPARQLVNALASASIGWGSDEEIDNPNKKLKDKTYSQVSEIIREITESDNSNDQIFADKLQQLQKFISTNNHRSALIEKRTQQAAEGQARTKQAKEAAKDALFTLMEHAQLPLPIADFLIKQWQQYLTIVHLKHNEESPEWVGAVQLANDLIWVCMPQKDEKSKTRLDSILASLFTGIQSGLDQVVNQTEEASHWIDIVRCAIEDLQKQHSETTAISADLKPLSTEHAKSLGHTPGSGSRSWKEMTALERQKARYHALTYEFIKKAESMPLNTWLSYQDSRDGTVLRCKLSGKINASDSFVFVDRFGFNVMEKARREFAYDLQQQIVTVLESGLLFDRAMSSITDNLRQLTKNKTDPKPV